MAEPTSPPPVRTRTAPAVEQAARVLYCLAHAHGARLSLTEICRQVGIHKSKGYAILNTLQEAGFATRGEISKTYGLGPGLLVLSRAVLDHSDLGTLAGPVLTGLSRDTRSTALLGQVQGDQVVIVARREAPNDLGVTIRVGHRYPLTWGAHGRAIVSALPPKRLDEVLAAVPLYFDGPPKPGHPPRENLEAELETVRLLGYATDGGRVHRGVRAVAAPVAGAGSGPVGCVIVVGTFSADEDDVIGQEVVAAARTLSDQLGPTLDRVSRTRA